MTIAIINFPGSNALSDVYHVLHCTFAKNNIKIIDCEEKELPSDISSIILPGGFTYGDYNGAGVEASQTPIMKDIKDKTSDGLPILGICNGFQILIESEILPGKLKRNIAHKFICRTEEIVVQQSPSIFLSHYNEKEKIHFPLACNYGYFDCSESTLQYMEERNMIALRYTQNNLSLKGIAGICNENGNVLGMMPHPERACGYRDNFDAYRMFLTLYEKI